MPEGWYDYGAQKWANIVTKNNGLTAYWVVSPVLKKPADNVTQSPSLQIGSTSEITTFGHPGDCANPLLQKESIKSSSK
nr:hypothetical protein [uncultured Flavobacterium sp.]